MHKGMAIHRDSGYKDRSRDVAVPVAVEEQGDVVVPGG